MFQLLSHTLATRVIIKAGRQSSGTQRYLLTEVFINKWLNDSFRLSVNSKNSAALWDSF